ncbi:response regulator [Piscirickettsia litoralis]|uniref:Response regulatory domain-containing protein n=1 Tax=Piscirickettsia litoralis TaxID=1891921 RepID=A0ABX3A2L6_9GAMM|nr:response regulator [Piscirickettsia litoralis]ODN43112.1 hypothetical protein BGC07_09525 [Piscirickettsia litoralis]
MALDKQHRYHILLVEDEVADANLLINALSHVDTLFSIDMVEHGETALAYLNRQAPYEHVVNPELLILDLNLPRVDGRELLAQLRANESFKNLAIIVLTTSHHEEDVAIAEEYQATYLQKPMSLEGLDRIARIIKQHCVESKS